MTHRIHFVDARFDAAADPRSQRREAQVAASLPGALCRDADPEHQGRVSAANADRWIRWWKYLHR